MRERRAHGKTASQTLCSHTHTNKTYTKMQRYLFQEAAFSFFLFILSNSSHIKNTLSKRISPKNT